jgi:quercetin dioxygenase-like cupin family protein
MKPMQKMLFAIVLAGFSLCAMAADGPPPHPHNAYVFVYVLEGTASMQVAGKEMETLSAGEMFYESPNKVHTISRNASDTEAATILVHMVRAADTPVSVPVE